MRRFNLSNLLSIFESKERFLRYDFQDCEMKFGSWTYNGFKVNFMLQQDYGDISTFIANGEWALLGTRTIPLAITIVPYHCKYCENTMSKKRHRPLTFYYRIWVIIIRGRILWG